MASSKISTGGSWTTARATDTFCFIPVNIFTPSTSRVSFIFSRSKSRSIRSPSSSCGNAMQPAEITDHLPAGHAIVNGRIGREKADLPADLAGRRDTSKPPTVAQPLVGRKTVLRIPARRGLAGPVRSQQAVDLPRAGMKTKRPQGLERAAADVRIALRQFVDVDHSA